MHKKGILAHISKIKYGFIYKKCCIWGLSEISISGGKMFRNKDVRVYICILWGLALIDIYRI